METRKIKLVMPSYRGNNALETPVLGLLRVEDEVGCLVSEPVLLGEGVEVIGIRPRQRFGLVLRDCHVGPRPSHCDLQDLTF